jgi:hypothetical protein
VLVDAERERRHSEAQWGRVLESLAYERGPWGVGSDDGGGDGALSGDGPDATSSGSGRRVYWMLDSSEDSLRCRHKLKRNPLGSSHAGAAQHATAAAHTAQKASPLPPPTPEKARASLGGSARSGSSALWKDLSRFQKKSDMVADVADGEQSENGDGAADGEGAASAARTRTIFWRTRPLPKTVAAAAQLVATRTAGSRAPNWRECGSTSRSSCCCARRSL